MSGNLFAVDLDERDMGWSSRRMAGAQVISRFEREFPMAVKVENSLLKIMFFVFNELENYASEEKVPAFRYQ